MRVAGQPFALASNLSAEMIEVVLGQSSFQECACIDTRSSVTLEVHMVTNGSIVFATEEVIETNLVQTCRAGECGKVSADSFGFVIGARDHHRGVPANVGANATLQMFVAGEPWFVFGRNGVHIRRGDGFTEVDMRFLCSLQQASQQIPCTILAVHFHHGVKRVEPLLCFARIVVWQLMDGTVGTHAHILPLFPTGLLARVKCRC